MTFSCKFSFTFALLFQLLTIADGPSWTSRRKLIILTRCGCKLLACLLERVYEFILFQLIISLFCFVSFFRFYSNTTTLGMVPCSLNTPPAQVAPAFVVAPDALSPSLLLSFSPPLSHSTPLDSSVLAHRPDDGFVEEVLVIEDPIPASTALIPLLLPCKREARNVASLPMFVIMLFFTLFQYLISFFSPPSRTSILVPDIERPTFNLSPPASERFPSFKPDPPVPNLEPEPPLVPRRRRRRRLVPIRFMSFRPHPSAPPVRIDLKKFPDARHFSHEQLLSLCFSSKCIINNSCSNNSSSNNHRRSPRQSKKKLVRFADEYEKYYISN